VEDLDEGLSDEVNGLGGLVEFIPEAGEVIVGLGVGGAALILALVVGTAAVGVGLDGGVGHGEGVFFLSIIHDNLIDSDTLGFKDVL